MTVLFLVTGAVVKAQAESQSARDAATGAERPLSERERWSRTAHRHIRATFVAPLRIGSLYDGSRWRKNRTISADASGPLGSV